MSNCKLVLFILYLLGLFIIFLNNYLSFLDKKVIEGYELTYWQVTHFVLYMIIGIFCPNRLYLFMLIGILWELIERSYGEFIGQKDYWTSNGIKGQVTDIIINYLGYMVSQLIV